MNKQKLDQIIENAKPRSDEFQERESVIISNEVLREEVLYLAKKIFGEDIYYKTTNRKFPALAISSFHKLKKMESWDGSELELYKKNGRNFFGKKEQYLQITPQHGMNGIVTANLLWSISIRAYTPDALEKAKLFAQAYKDFAKQTKLKTNLEADIIQCFKTPRLEELTIEASQKKKRHNPEITSEDHLGEMLNGLKVSTDGRIELKKKEREFFDWVKKFKVSLEEYLGKSYRVKETSVFSSDMPDIMKFYSLSIYERKTALGFLPLDVKIAAIIMLQDINSNLTIKLKTPESLEVMAVFSKKYQELTGSQVELVKQY